LPQVGEDEVRAVIARMKVKKAPGIDNITAGELAAASQGSGLRILHRLRILIWDNEQVPSEWKQSVIVPTHKKKDKLECSNYRGISLLCQCSKVFSSIILRRIKKKPDEILSRSAGGFSRPQKYYRPDLHTEATSREIRRIWKGTLCVLHRH
jgi:hypothetical protein